VREVPRRPVDVHVLRIEARAALVERLAEHVAHGAQQLLRPAPRDRRRRLLAVQAHRPQRLVGVDVADAAHEPLVEEHPLDARRAPRHPPEEQVVVECRVERIAGDVRDLRGNARRPLPRDVGTEPRDRAIGRRHHAVDGERAERALVEEVDAELAVLGMLEVDAHARMTVVARMLGRPQQHLAAHAEVPDDRPLAAERQPQELAPAHGGGDRRTRRERLEVAGCRVMPRERTWVEHVDRRDARTGDRRRQAGAHDLDLGKLRHVRTR